MQTALASLLRNRSIFPSRICCYTTTRPRRPDLFLHQRWSTTYRCSIIEPRVRLVRAFASHSKASQSPVPPPASDSAAHGANKHVHPSAPSSRSPPPEDPQVSRPSPTSPTMNGANTSPRAKRKPSPFEMESARPPKHLRSSQNGKQSAGDNTPDVEAEDFEMRDHDFIDEGALSALPALGPDSQEWQATIENVVRNVVSIRFCQTCSFDTDPALNSEATGFVVDAERGYILTNRHVVGSGPFWGYCIFDNHEEVDAYPVYRDPVHDFGILKFDPKAIKYMPVKALPLRPDLAKG